MNKKNLIQYACACVLLAAGVTLVFFGFFTVPRGEVARSVLQFFAECLIWAASVFGMTAYVDMKIHNAFRNKNKQS